MKVVLEPAQGLPYTNYLAADEAIRGRKTSLQSLPPFIRIEVTSRCNLSCEHCWNAHYWLSGRDLDQAVLAKLEREVLPAAAALQCTDLGEPFLYRHFERVLDLFASFRFPFSKIFTNGQVMSPSLASRVLLSGLRELAVSVDGATAETYERIRKGASYARLITNLRMLADLKKELGQVEPIFTFNVVVMEQNLGELEDIVTMAADYGAAQIFFFNLHAITQEIARRAPICFPAETKTALERAFSRARSLGIEARTDIDLGDRAFLDGLHKMNRPAFHKERPAILIEATPENPSFCEYPWKYISVKVDGSIHPCRSLSIPIGNLNDQSFTAIWNSPVYRRLRQSILNGSYEMCRGAGCHFMAPRYGELRAEIEVLDPPSLWYPGERRRVRVEVRNAGTVVWNAQTSPDNPIHYTLAYHILAETGEVLIFDGFRTEFPKDLDPGSDAIINMDIEAPHEPGRYMVNIDVVRELVTWFGSIGSTTCYLGLHVSPEEKI